MFSQDSKLFQPGGIVQRTGKGEPAFQRHLSGRNSETPASGCLYCAIRDSDPRFSRLELFRTSLMLVSFYLYPYNPGHLTISPSRHLTDIRDLSLDEVLELFKLQVRAMTVLETLYAPRGFNIGFNQDRRLDGENRHVNCQVIPRYKNEIGMVELTSRGSRCLVEDPLETLEKLRAAFSGNPAQPGP
jgi:ATP adenylyltransferase